MESMKARTAGYWSRRAEQFAGQRMREYYSDKHALWLEELHKYLPAGAPLSILDVGTGTGFFAMLLGAEGHRVTGIDLCADMIEQARKTSGLLKVPADFFVMDAERPDLAPASFDAVITRNLTWGLPHLGEAYRAWHGLLRPGGVLVNFDADYCREDKNQLLPARHAHQDIGAELMAEYESLKEQLRPGQRPRPQWDRELLEEAGFRQIQVDLSVWKRIYSSFDEFYNPTPIFVITAQA